MISRHSLILLSTLLLSLTVLNCTGCVGGLAQLFYVLKGHEIPAQYNELDSNSVAVIVHTDASAYGSDSLSDTLEKFITINLVANVPGVAIVPKIKVANWIDIHGTDQSKLAKLGRDVGADYVLSVAVDDYSIREGSTIYKGKAEVTISVVDSESGDSTYVAGPDRLEYPENGRPAIQTDDRKFEMFYLSWLSEQISKQFYKHDPTQEVADDAALMR